MDYLGPSLWIGMRVKRKNEKQTIKIIFVLFIQLFTIDN
jgi:hypothetical protein